MYFAIVFVDSLNVASTYGADSSTQSSYGGEWGSPQVTVHLEVPEGLDPQCIMAVRSEDGTITLEADPIKVQAKLDAAWTQLRAERNRRLAATDWVALSDAHLSQDRKDAWFAYRQELRDLPDVVTESMLVATSPSDSVPWPLDPTQVAQVAPTGSRLNGILGQV